MNWMTRSEKILVLNTDIDTKRFSKKILKNEQKIIKKYPPTSYHNVITDGGTGLGTNSLTSRFFHFNVLKWLGTGSLKKWIRFGYEQYTGLEGKSLYCQCWANVMRDGQKINSHKHLEFDTDTNHYLCGNFVVQCNGLTNTYYQNTPVLNTDGDMTFFSGNVFHWTDTHYGSFERITVAFDICSEEYMKHTPKKELNNRWVKL